ncbi:MAG: hypothetical protein ACK4UJ_11930 [Leptonema sp. (in: bacteria)]
MNQNHCQNVYSCFSCCGLLNFQLAFSELIQILQERTNELKNIRSFSRENLLQYRFYRENKEKNFRRFSDEIYICPFLGFLDSTKIGCMIHPSITTNPFLQDVSFYKSTICQSYNCRVKEEDEKIYLKLIHKVLQINFSIKNLLRFVNEKNPSTDLTHIKTFLYSRLVSDVVFYNFVKHYFDFEQILTKRRNFLFFLSIVGFRLRSYFNVTSFEINFLNFYQQSFEENLIKLLPEIEKKKKFINKYKNLLKKAYNPL